MKLLYAAFAVACLLFIHPAFADTVSTVATAPGPVATTTTTSVSLPIGDWIGQVAKMLLALTGIAVAWLVRELPGQYAAILKVTRADQLLQKALEYGINATAGAEKGKVLDLNVGNEVLAKAAQYAVDNGPGALIDWMGGKEGIAQKIVARLDLAPEASITAPASTTQILKPASPRAA